jgi:hypothetical protein
MPIPKYVNEYKALNSLDGYKEIRESMNKLITELNELEAEGYDTRFVKRPIDIMNEKLYEMNALTMRMQLSKQKPWEKLNISRQTWINDQRKLYNNESTPTLRKRYNND